MTTADAHETSSVQLPSEVVIVDANESTKWIDWREIWRYRELVWIFAVRDIKVRYRQTIVGVAWTLLQPLGQMFAFGILKRMLVSQAENGRIPDDVSMFCALLLYQLFSGICTTATTSLVDNRMMVTKVYFPRMILPLSSCLRPLLDFGIGLLVLFLLMLWFKVVPSFEIFVAPVVVLVTVTFSFGLGLWLSALNAHYRDFAYIVPFLLQLGLIVSPVAYEASRVPERWRWLYFLNPMVALLDAFRWTILQTPFPAWQDVVMSLMSIVLITVTGTWYFHRVDRFMADNI